jgi:D-lactate dehydrogenase (cytochrome)
MPSGETWSVKRTDHKLRKILHEDEVTYEIFDQQGKSLKEVKLRGVDVRKKGLWKDITNKALGGVPGLQKEGTDGVITSAVFVLYPKYKVTKTLCLEFFGPDMDEASQVIVEISRRFPLPKADEEALLALEHFDDEYIRAIDYNVKALRPETPKAVLLIDIAGNSEADVEKGINRAKEILESHPNTLMFVARDEAEAKRFWQDRKRLSAIARRTNAFKLNEDVVIPLHALGAFAEFIDELNVQQERYSQSHFLDRVLANLNAAEVKEDAEQFKRKINSAVELCAKARTELEQASDQDLRSLRIIDEFRQQLCDLVHGYPKMVEVIEYLHKHIRDRRIVIATHMHAGDGNVHVNIPVLSNDQDMMERADHVVDLVMEKVVSMDGVVPGEHGIGLTKLKYLDKSIINELSDYRKQVDPKGIINPGKLNDKPALDHIFTPSFNLLELEAHILKRAQIEELSKKVDYCIRCGKCKIDCCVFYPARGMFYHPRNKNLAIGSLIEALLYDAQRGHSTDFKLLKWLEEVADHCTICHKCLKPCPVDIDTGEVSINERRILEGWGYKHTSFMTKQTLNYLNSRSPNYNNAFRTIVLKLGGSLQRMGKKITSPLQPEDEAPKFYPLQMLRSAVPPPTEETLRDVLPNCEPDQVLVFDPEREAKGTVFYFPGCGSERLNANISMAALHSLTSQNIRVILPPPFLCCGFPAHVNAKDDQYNKILLRNTVMFSQIREMFSYLEFDACLISCGTCMEGLDKMQADALFGGQVMDVAEYLQQKGLVLNSNNSYMYHAPCHDSLNGKAKKVLKSIGGFDDVVSVPNCCSEAGTLALSRPDITDSMLQRKRVSIKEATKENNAKVVLTNCPSCVQGLGRNLDMGIEPRHIMVDLAEKISGKDWQRQFIEKARSAKAVSF